jgi:hypothetical protein
VGFLSTPTPAVVKLVCQNKFVKTNVRADLESPPGSGGGGRQPWGWRPRARPMGQVREECARFAPFKRPTPHDPHERADHLATPRVESRLTSTRWRARRRRTEAQASAFGNAPSSSLLLVTAPGRVPGGLVVTWACTARAGRSRVLLAKLLGEGDNQINLDFFDERVSNARAGWLGVASYTSEKATHPLGSRKDEA